MTSWSNGCITKSANWAVCEVMPNRWSETGKKDNFAFFSAVITLAAYKMRKKWEEVQESLKNCFAGVCEIFFDVWAVWGTYRNRTVSS